MRKGWQRRRVLDALAAALVAAGVLAQILYPLLSGPALTRVTVLTVLLLAAAALVHAAAWAGPRAALTFGAASAGLGLLAEAVGVRSGVPFGQYAYTGTLGPQVLGVPLLVPLAWTMMAYPCLLLARRLAVSRAAVAVLGGWTLAAWDLFLDPQMVAAGHWRWAFPDPGLHGVPGIPLTNLAGWLVVGTAMTALLDAVLPRRRRSVRAEAVPAALLLWTWLGSALGNLAFFDRPWVALYGALAMAVTMIPYLRALATAAPVRAAHPRPPHHPHRVVA